ncbi:MAG: PilN domain-containing protein [Limnochordia bacterium]|nr:PilN domain-containing protein [Limnochordia bacterium]
MTFSNNLLPDYERVSRRPKVNWIKILVFVSLPLVIWMGAYNILIGKNIGTMKSRLDTAMSQSRQLDSSNQELSSLRDQREELQNTIATLSGLLSSEQTIDPTEMEHILHQVSQVRPVGIWIQNVSFVPERLLIEGISSNFESAMSFGQSLGAAFTGFQVNLKEIEEYTVGGQTFYQFRYDLGYGG